MSLPDEPDPTAEVPGPAGPTPRAEAQELSTAPGSPRKRTLVVAMIAGGLVVTGAVAWILVSSLQPTQLEAAAEACAGSKPLDALIEEVGGDSGLGDSSELASLFDGVVVIEDDGRTLILDTPPQDQDALGVTSLALDCVYEALDAPARVTESIGQTRALDGRQSDAWDDFTVQWSYHPDSGANVIIAMK